MIFTRFFRFILFAFLILFSGLHARAQFIDSVKAYIIEKQIQHPDIVLKQAILETGWFKSRFLMRKKNLFGFTTEKGYIRFSTWKHSVDYYKTWQDEAYTDLNEDYYHFLKRIRYARSPAYIRTLKRIKIPG